MSVFISVWSPEAGTDQLKSLASDPVKNREKIESLLSQAEAEVSSNKVLAADISKMPNLSEDAENMTKILTDSAEEWSVLVKKCQEVLQIQGEQS